jgi:hypothetical protein
MRKTIDEPLQKKRFCHPELFIDGEGYQAILG